MSGFLLLLFVFQSGLACAFTFFITRLVLQGGQDGGGAAQRKPLPYGWLLGCGAAASCIIPLLVFGAFLASLPEDAERSIAVWPAVWVAMIMFGGWTGAALAIRKLKLASAVDGGSSHD
jgi:hypothetical protein